MFVHAHVQSLFVTVSESILHFVQSAVLDKEECHARGQLGHMVDSTIPHLGHPEPWKLREGLIIQDLWTITFPLYPPGQEGEGVIDNTSPIVDWKCGKSWFLCPLAR